MLKCKISTCHKKRKSLQDDLTEKPYLEQKMPLHFEYESVSVTNQ
jgi:hypothetical protein